MLTQINLMLAKSTIHSAENEATCIGVPMAISIVNEGGNLIAFHKMDNTPLASIELSINKAWTAASLQMPTAALASLAAPGGPLYGIHTTHNGQIVIFGGGVPLIQRNNLVGALA